MHVHRQTCSSQAARTSHRKASMQGARPRRIAGGRREGRQRPAVRVGSASRLRLLAVHARLQRHRAPARRTASAAQSRSVQGRAGLPEPSHRPLRRLARLISSGGGLSHGGSSRSRSGGGARAAQQRAATLGSWGLYTVEAISAWTAGRPRGKQRSGGHTGEPEVGQLALRPVSGTAKESIACTRVIVHPRRPESALTGAGRRSTAAALWAAP